MHGEPAGVTNLKQTLMGATLADHTGVETGFLVDRINDGFDVVRLKAHMMGGLQIEVRIRKPECN